MPLLNHWDDLKIDADGVLRGQGADPAIIRQRSPRLLDVAEQALEEGRALLQPRVLYRRMSVESLRHDRLSLEGGACLKGELIAQKLGPVDQVVVILCTVGKKLETYASEIMKKSQVVYGLALDGVASAAVEALANAACQRFEQEAADQGLQTTIPLSPGMVGWTIEEGQPQLFELLDGSEIGMALTESCIMTPIKSLSMVLGVGKDLGYAGTICDYCAMRSLCQYRDNSAQSPECSE